MHNYCCQFGKFLLPQAELEIKSTNLYSGPSDRLLMISIFNATKVLLLVVICVNIVMERVAMRIDAMDSDGTSFNLKNKFGVH